METTSFDIRRVRTGLVLDQPFFGTLAMHLELVEDSSIETLQTNGVELRFNPAFMQTLSVREQTAVVAHEVLHCGLLHPYRRGSRDLREWNVACDYAVNAQLVETGFTLPAGCLIDAQYDGMSAEQIFSKRRAAPMQEPEQGPDPDEDEDEDPEDEEQPGDVNEPDEDADADDENGDEDGQSDECSECGADTGDGEGYDGKCGSCADQAETSMPGCPTGEFVDGPAAGEAGEGDLTAEDWEEIASEAALVASRAGDLPGGVGRAIAQTREPSIDWKAETQDFVTNTIATDWSWSRPNRRLISHGLYLPGAIKENVGELVIGIDTSCSITQGMLNDFASELVGLMRDARPERIHVVYCDTQVNGVQEFETDDEIKLTLMGGGGTRFQPVFDWVAENNLDPIGLIYLTDLEGPAPEMPAYPVLWITPLHSYYPAPFGQIARMSA